MSETKPMTDEELEACRARDLDSEKTGSVQGFLNDRRALLAEVDRLRRLDKLAREWLAVYSNDFDSPPGFAYECRMRYRTAVEGGK